MGWTIKDDQGYEYTFEAEEYTTQGGGPHYRSAWYLTSILSPQGAYATFHYENTTVRPMPVAVETYDVERKRGGGGNGDPTWIPARYQSNISFSQSDITQPWLKEIVLRNQTVTFDKSRRTDLRGSMRLDNIRISTPSGHTVSRYHFNYGIFTGCTVGGRCFETSDNGYCVAENTRLKLTGVSQVSVTGTDSISHRFSYYEDYPLPRKTSYARDFWGYYNGAENKDTYGGITGSHTAIPSLSDCMINYIPQYKPEESSLTMKGAQRFSNRKYLTSCTLRGITYPTGGYTEFRFEPHEFVSSPAYPLYGEGYANIDKILYFYNPAMPTTADHQRIDVADRAIGTVKITFSGTGNTKIRDLKRLGARLLIASMSLSQANSILISLDACADADDNSTTYTCIRNIELPPGSYMASVNFVTTNTNYSNTGSINAEVKLRDIPENKESGGGLRIAAIESYDGSGHPAGKTEFLYKKDDGTTSGELLCGAIPMEAVTMYTKASDDPYDRNIYQFNILRLHSSFIGVKAITSVQMPGEVGYHTQTERHYDKDGNLRKSVERQFNLVKASHCLQKFYLMQTPGGGEITSCATYNSDGKMVTRERYYYSTRSNSPVKCNTYAQNNYYNHGVGWTCKEDSLGLELTGTPHYSIYVYSYPRHWRTLSSKVTEEFTPGGRIETKTGYSYNQGNHLVSDETVSGTAYSLRRHYSYPTDYKTGTYATMGKDPYHITGVRVETQDYLKHNGSEKKTEHTKINYTYNRNLPMAFRPTDYLCSEGDAPLTKRMTVRYDDDTGNIVEAVKDSVEMRVILWSYDNLYPVAVIDGALLSEVKAWAGTQFLTRLSSANTGIGEMLTTLRNQLAGKNVLVTTYEYIPLVGISKEVSPNGDIRQYRYDGLNRLTAISDADGNDIQQFEYHYDN